MGGKKTNSLQWLMPFEIIKSETREAKAICSEYFGFEL